MWGGGDGVLTWRPCLFSCRVLAVLVTWRSSDELVRVASEGVSWRRQGTHLGPCGPSVGCCLRWRRREVWDGCRMRRGQWWWWWWEGRSGVADICTLFPHLGSHGPPSPRVGYIYLRRNFWQACIAQLAGALVFVSLVLGSILAYVKIYFFLI